MRMPRFALLPISLSFAFAAVSAMAQSTTETTCPTGTGEHAMSGLTFCIPHSNQRYPFTPNGIGPIYWLGEEPIAPPADSDSLKDADVTVARAWVDPTIVGTSDEATGKNGFDRFMQVVATHILKAEKAANGAREFMADVPTDESGVLEPFKFQLLASGVLKGVRQDLGGSEAYVILMRPAIGDSAPHLMFCGVVSIAHDPPHLCMNFVALLDQRLAITVAGKNVERSFRISEEVSKDLASFVKRPEP